MRYKTPVTISLFAAGLLLACSSYPSAQEVVDRSSPVVCDKLKECEGDSLFQLAFPGGVDECVSKVKASTAKKYGNDLERRSTCTDDELNKCLEDYKATACPKDGSLPPAPCDC